MGTNFFEQFNEQQNGIFFSGEFTLIHTKQLNGFHVNGSLSILIFLPPKIRDEQNEFFFSCCRKQYTHTIGLLLFSNAINFTSNAHELAKYSQFSLTNDGKSPMNYIGLFFVENKKHNQQHENHFRCKLVCHSRSLSLHSRSTFI